MDKDRADRFNWDDDDGIVLRKPKGKMEINLDPNHGLFKKLKDGQFPWWENLKADPEVYIDIRKNNSLNVYYNGGSIMKLEWKNEFKGQIHFEYVPFQRESDYWPFEFQTGNISLKQNKTEAIAINNFEQKSLEMIKSRVRKFYPNDSEKGIQGHYVTRNNNHSKKLHGFFIDTEFAYKDKHIDIRIDLIWVDLEKKKIALVELKTIGDPRLYEGGVQSQDTIDGQLKKYYVFAKENKKEILQYYSKIFSIKKSLEILPKFIMEKSLEEFELIEKPILLVGDCTQKWIDNNAVTLNKKLRDIAFGCVYQGRNTFEFRIPYKTTQYYYRLDTD
jgi:hypothetical protein